MVNGTSADENKLILVVHMSAVGVKRSHYYLYSFTDFVIEMDRKGGLC